MNDAPSSPEHPKKEKIDVGAILRQTRLNRGQSLEAVYEKTRIPKKLLEALEGNRVDAFSASVYLRGFLKGYCDYLDLNFEDLWKQLAPNRESPQEPKTKKDFESAQVPWARPWTQIFQPLTESYLMPLLLILGLLAGTAAVWVFQEETTPKLTAHKPPPLPEAMRPINSNEKIGLRVAASKDTWIRLKVDDVLRFEGRMPAGTIQDWKAKNGFALKAVAPEDLRLVLEGKPVSLDQFPLGPGGFHTITR